MNTYKKLLSNISSVLVLSTFNTSNALNAQYDVRATLDVSLDYYASGMVDASTNNQITVSILDTRGNMVSESQVPNTSGELYNLN